MSNTTEDSIREDNETGGAVPVTRTITDAELIRAAQQVGAQQVVAAGARPTFGSPSLRSRDALTRAPLSMQASSIESIEGFDDDTKPFVAQAMTAMDTMRSALDQIIAAREASKKNPTWTEANQVLATAELAGKLQDRATRTVDATVAALEKAINGTEGVLRSPLEGSNTGTLSSEIRAHAKSLKTDAERHALLKDAVDQKDVRTLSALLNAPLYLSGLTKLHVDVYTELYNRTRFPAEAKRLAVMKAAHETLTKTGAHFLTQVEKAQGVKWHVVQRLRTAKTDAEKAFVLQG